MSVYPGWLPDGRTMHLDTLTLRSGSHPSPNDGMCLLEAVSYFAGEPWSDAPACVDRTLAAFGRSWNDGMRTDAERDQLVPYVPVLVGTAGTDDDAARRAWLALDWSVRVSTPAWLDLAGLADHAERLRRLPEIDASNCSDDIDDPESMAEYRIIKEALEDARSAAAAARDAAWAAARAAAWDAARGAAARAAAWDALEPTCGDLQRSAHRLFRSMVAAGPHDAEALASLPEASA